VILLAFVLELELARLLALLLVALSEEQLEGLSGSLLAFQLEGMSLVVG
jgi:hypothetical protein